MYPMYVHVHSFAKCMYHINTKGVHINISRYKHTYMYIQREMYVYIYICIYIVVNMYTLIPIAWPIPMHVRPYIAWLSSMLYVCLIPMAWTNAGPPQGEGPLSSSCTPVQLCGAWPML